MAVSMTDSRPGLRLAETAMYTTAARKRMIDVQPFSRSPRTWWASSTRRYSVQNRPTVYAATYSAKARPWPSLKRRSAQMTSSATPMHHSDSYRKVGWYVPATRPIDGSASIFSAQGRSVLRPYSSWLNQLPQRPMACAMARPGARVSAQAGNGTPRRRQRAERAERHGAPDAESALPDLEGVHPVPTRAEVQLVVGDHVVEPSADEPEGHRPHGDVGDGPRCAAPGDPTPVADPDGDEDADDDAERVAAQRYRAEVNHAGRRAGNVSEVHDRDDATVPNAEHGNPPDATAA
ncbi:hypothetical protein ADK38_16410 [Streptomyces varsoviensis]|uniref:Uncharacterized protein n=1 Tax=Streptomyces varsoviensis TaxID=67373 RepID=A0ABR5J6F8_9ACTN|nr:hypothetical protein ADK38_16410 [Streptomyces varsoviensis]